MTFESYANRLTKHFNQYLRRRVGPKATGTIDLTSKIPVLSFLGIKQHPQGNGGRKNNSAHAKEHAQANRDNLNPYQGADGKWYWMDDDGVPNDRSYVTREQAEIALTDYRLWLLKGTDVSTPVPNETL
jgi:hypothetical protein